MDSTNFAFSETLCYRQHKLSRGFVSTGPTHEAAGQGGKSGQKTRESRENPLYFSMNWCIL